MVFYTLSISIYGDYGDGFLLPYQHYSKNPAMSWGFQKPGSRNLRKSHVVFARLDSGQCCARCPVPKHTIQKILLPNLDQG